jgi:hypothetical protein
MRFSFSPPRCETHPAGFAKAGAMLKESVPIMVDIAIKPRSGVIPRCEFKFRTTLVRLKAPEHHRVRE